MKDRSCLSFMFYKIMADRIRLFKQISLKMIVLYSYRVKRHQYRVSNSVNSSPCTVSLVMFTCHGREVHIFHDSKDIFFNANK